MTRALAHIGILVYIHAFEPIKFLASFKGKGERASGPLDLIHTNVYGPMSTHSKGGFIYFITLLMTLHGMGTF